MIVSHRHHFVFIKTRKTAGTSVEIALSRHCGPEDTVTPISPEDETLRAELGGIGPQRYEVPDFPVHAFAHMRGRVIRRSIGTEAWNNYFKFAIERNPWDAVVSYYHYRFRERQAIPFEKFVMSKRIERLAVNQRMIRIEGRVAVDFVCRYENLNEDLETVWSRIGLEGPPGLPHAKGGNRPRPGYQDYYGPSERGRVAEVFAETIRDFRYEF